MIFPSEKCVENIYSQPLNLPREALNCSRKHLDFKKIPGGGACLWISLAGGPSFKKVHILPKTTHPFWNPGYGPGAEYSQKKYTPCSLLKDLL